MKLLAYCLQCGHKHKIDFDPSLPTQLVADWYTKHAGHEGVGLKWPERPAAGHWTKRHVRRFMKVAVSKGIIYAEKLLDKKWPGDYREAAKLPSQFAALLSNADVKIAYGASAGVTITLASLAASSTLLAGRESTAVDNGASNKYLDELLAGHYKAAATNNQAGTIRTAVVGNEDDTPTWGDVFDGTDSVETVTDAPTYDSLCRIISDIANDNTASQVWYWGPVAIAGMFGGWLPDQYVVFVSQSCQTSTNAWDSTEGSHGVKRTPVFATVI